MERTFAFDNAFLYHAKCPFIEHRRVAFYSLPLTGHSGSIWYDSRKVDSAFCPYLSYTLINVTLYIPKHAPHSLRICGVRVRGSDSKDRAYNDARGILYYYER